MSEEHPGRAMDAVTQGVLALLRERVASPHLCWTMNEGEICGVLAESGVPTSVHYVVVSVHVYSQTLYVECCLDVSDVDKFRRSFPIDGLDDAIRAIAAWFEKKNQPLPCSSFLRYVVCPTFNETSSLKMEQSTENHDPSESTAMSVEPALSDAELERLRRIEKAARAVLENAKVLEGSIAPIAKWMLDVGLAPLRKAMKNE